jgi:hypothetical protein
MSHQTLLQSLGADHLWLLQESSSPSADAIGSLDSAVWSNAAQDASDGPGSLTGLDDSVLTSSSTSGYIQPIVLTTAPAALQDMGESGGEFTIGGWIKTTSSGGTYELYYSSVTIFEFIDLSSTLPTYNSVPAGIGLVSGDNLFFGCQYGTLGNRNIGQLVSSTLPAINDGDWHFFAITRDGTTIKGYVDGVLETMGTIPSGDYSVGTTNTNLRIGAASLPNGSSVDGIIANFAGFFIDADTAYTKTQLDSLYNLLPILTSETGSYDVTPYDTVLTKFNSDGDIVVSVSGGSYVLSGQDVNLSKYSIFNNIEHGSYIFTGQDINLKKAYSIAIAEGSYTLTGQDISAARKASLSNGSYTFTGQDLNLLKSIIFKNLENSSYVLSGQDISYYRTLPLISSVGQFDLLDTDASLIKSSLLSLAGDSYVLTGQDIGLLRKLLFDVDNGSYTLSGYDLDFIKDLLLNIETGTYTISSTDISLLSSLYNRVAFVKFKLR